MDTIEKFTAADADRVAAEAVEALRALVSKYGLTVEDRGGRYNVGTFTVRIEFAVANSDKVKFERYATSFGVKPEDWGREFEFDGTTCRLVGVLLGSRAFDFRVVDVATGKEYDIRRGRVQRVLYPPAA